MNDFLEKWNNDKKFKTKVQLCLYTMFVIIVSIFAFSKKDNINTEKLENKYNNSFINNEKDNEQTIKIPDEYNYKINITINELEHKYAGNKTSNKETIIKETDGIQTNYIYENKKYYKKENDNYTLTDKDEIYDIIEHDYIKLETINKYLKKAIKENNIYKVYLKDILLMEESEKYITITIDNNITEIDYTELIQKFDKSIEKYLVKIEIE